MSTSVMSSGDEEMVSGPDEETVTGSDEYVSSSNEEVMSQSSNFVQEFLCSRTSGMRVRVEDAQSYLDEVKYQFQSEPQVYYDFLKIMNEFKSGDMGTPEVIARIYHLFQEHLKLINGLTHFLPPGVGFEVHKNDQGCDVRVFYGMEID
ncbi:hypothetical protein TKK_0003259 [Trichogramma kaykai]|uniref:Uncharacterized protein n=1 Tax=Trichogramma kaykai TaxID=54128 RepID=A0ABD2WUJ0_9HYME